MTLVLSTNANPNARLVLELGLEGVITRELHQHQHQDSISTRAMRLPQPKPSQTDTNGTSKPIQSIPHQIQAINSVYCVFGMTYSHGQEDDGAPQDVEAVVVKICEGPQGDEHAHGHHGQDAGHRRLSGRVGQNEHEAPRQQQTTRALDHLVVVP